MEEVQARGDASGPEILSVITMKMVKMVKLMKMIFRNRCLTQFDAFSRLSEPILLSQWSFVSHRNSLTHISVHFASGAKKDFRFKLFCISFAPCPDPH